MQRDYPPGPEEALLLQGQLLDVQEDVGAEAPRTAEGVREAGEEDPRPQVARPVEKAGGEEAEGDVDAQAGEEQDEAAEERGGRGAARAAGQAQGVPGQVPLPRSTAVAAANFGFAQ